MTDERRDSVEPTPAQMVALAKMMARASSYCRQLSNEELAAELFARCVFEEGGEEGLLNELMVLEACQRLDPLYLDKESH